MNVVVWMIFPLAFLFEVCLFHTPLLCGNDFTCYFFSTPVSVASIVHDSEEWVEKEKELCLESLMVRVECFVRLFVLDCRV